MKAVTFLQMLYATDLSTAKSALEVAVLDNGLLDTLVGLTNFLPSVVVRCETQFLESVSKDCLIIIY